MSKQQFFVQALFYRIHDDTLFKRYSFIKQLTIILLYLKRKQHQINCPQIIIHLVSLVQIVIKSVTLSRL